MTHLDDRLTVITAEIMPPEAANFSGKVHGGYLLHSLDRVAYACATRYAKNYAVTLSVDQVFFREPIYVGELVTFFASINYVGKTSMEVGIKVMSEDLETGKIRHTNTCYFTMVAMDTHGKPTPAPEYTPKTDEQKRRYEEAKLRRELRMEYMNEHKKRKESVQKKLDG